MFENHAIVVDEAIAFIGKNVLEKISSREVARYCGISHWYFQRIFKKHTGENIGEYIRKRRLTNAAQRLIRSKERIIDIAMEHHFTTQESFTRAFKMLFAMPPAKYRTQFRDFLFHKEAFQLTAPTGWMISGSNPQDYLTGIDYTTVHTGKASAYLQGDSKLTPNGFVTMMQEIKTDLYIGKRIRLSAFAKADTISGSGALWMRVDTANGDTVAFDNMHNRLIKGTHDWGHCSVVLDIPADASTISFGFLLSGEGKLFMDGMKFEEVDETIPVTDIRLGEVETLGNEPVNLGFER
ncbi:helix-turn-helix transcriptional regulator [Sporosarcina limicola]|uniref:AraC-like DNA-binding protein n=1 Tax=Sporosarcina limicola TaxID=34101 RepID=A0A927MEP7_9BACL|nr:AraC family transcriptional regulator [Sporosarcina limicola]MBE1553190.1 AraC-like DNA-binding protein [Sporosarcina limicola]